MTRLRGLFAIGLTLTLTACGAATSIVNSVGTAQVSTAILNSSTALPSNDTPSPTLPPLPDGLGLTELKYRVLEQFPDLFFCDPDYYPVARDDELDLARQRFAELQANAEEFNAILVHNNLSGLTTFTDDQKLLIYREHKKLAAVQFELTTKGYQFQLQVAESEGTGEFVSGLIDGQGVMTNVQREPSFATCPICLAGDTLIDTLTGPMPIQSLRVGTWVWTINRAGARVALPLIEVSETIVAATHQVVHLVLNDGRELWVSPGHPTVDARTVGQLHIGDWLDGAIVLLVERVKYEGAATYDVLPAGDTGFYWANGILIASTLKSDEKTP